MSLNKSNKPNTTQENPNKLENLKEVVITLNLDQQKELVLLIGTICNASDAQNFSLSLFKQSWWDFLENNMGYEEFFYHHHPELFNHYMIKALQNKTKLTRGQTMYEKTLGFTIQSPVPINSLKNIDTTKRNTINAALKDLYYEQFFLQNKSNTITKESGTILEEYESLYAQKIQTLDPLRDSITKHIIRSPIYEKFWNTLRTTPNTQNTDKIKDSIDFVNSEMKKQGCTTAVTPDQFLQYYYDQEYQGKKGPLPFVWKNRVKKNMLDIPLGQDRGKIDEIYKHYTTYLEARNTVQETTVLIKTHISGALDMYIKKEKGKLQKEITKIKKDIDKMWWESENLFVGENYTHPLLPTNEPRNLNELYDLHRILCIEGKVSTDEKERLETLLKKMWGNEIKYTIPEITKIKKTILGENNREENKLKTYTEDDIVGKELSQEEWGEIRDLHLWGDHKIIPQWIKNCTNLTYINIGGKNTISDLSPLSKLSNLTEIGIGGKNTISDFSPLSELSNLTRIHIRGKNTISDLSPLSELSNLQSIYITGDNTINDFSPLSELSNLTYIDIGGKNTISDLSPLSKLSNLTRIHIKGDNTISDLSPLSKLSNLTMICIEGNNTISNFSPLSKLPNLTMICIEGNNTISNSSPLPKLPNLTEIEIIKFLIEEKKECNTKFSSFGSDWLRGKFDGKGRYHILRNNKPIFSSPYLCANPLQKKTSTAPPSPVQMYICAQEYKHRPIYFTNTRSLQQIREEQANKDIIEFFMNTPPADKSKQILKNLCQKENLPETTNKIQERIQEILSYLTSKRIQYYTVPYGQPYSSYRASTASDKGYRPIALPGATTTAQVATILDTTIQVYHKRDYQYTNHINLFIPHNHRIASLRIRDVDGKEKTLSGDNIEAIIKKSSTVSIDLSSYTNRETLRVSYTATKSIETQDISHHEYITRLDLLAKSNPNLHTLLTQPGLPLSVQTRSYIQQLEKTNKENHEKVSKLNAYFSKNPPRHDIDKNMQYACTNNNRQAIQELYQQNEIWLGEEMSLLITSIKNKSPQEKSKAIVSWIHKNMIYDIGTTIETNSITKQEQDFLAMLHQHKNIKERKGRRGKTWMQLTKKSIVGVCVTSARLYDLLAREAGLATVNYGGFSKKTRPGSLKDSDLHAFNAFVIPDKGGELQLFLEDATPSSIIPDRRNVLYRLNKFKKPLFFITICLGLLSCFENEVQGITKKISNRIGFDLEQEIIQYMPQMILWGLIGGGLIYLLPSTIKKIRKRLKNSKNGKEIEEEIEIEEESREGEIEGEGEGEANINQKSRTQDVPERLENLGDNNATAYYQFAAMVFANDAQRDILSKAMYQKRQRLSEKVKRTLKQHGNDIDTVDHILQNEGGDV